MLDILHGEVVEVQLPPQGREALRARFDGADPDPGIRGQVGRCRAEALEGHGVGFEDPIPGYTCLHARSVPEHSEAKEPNALARGSG